MNTAENRAYWDSRAQLGETAGTQDLILKELEQRAILVEIVKTSGAILEVGCGLGETARLVSDAVTQPSGHTRIVEAIDSSPAMILAAHAADENSAVIWRLGDVMDPPPHRYGCIYSQRCLINLPSWEAQKQAINAIADRLVTGGRFLMCEHSHDGLGALNRARIILGLKYIEPPWHNQYTDAARLAEITSLRLVRCYRFSAAYYFLSRIINARLYCEPKYDSWINRLALMVPYWLFGTRWAQGQLLIWEKP